jgi:hypothetical protein
MSEHSQPVVPTSDEKADEFNPILYRFRNLEIEDMEGGFIEIGNGHTHVILDAQEVLALRNWLNKVFPNE